jgi:NTE family protein
MSVRIGVALSSGGAAGLAHIGVLEELVAAGIEIECVAGTSAGAMVGAAFAGGRLAEFRERMMAWSRKRRVSLFDPIWPRNGLLGGRRAMDMIGPCATGNIEDLPLRYAAVATDLDTGRLVVLSSGGVCAAIRASIAIPGVFTPQLLHGRRLVDGALLDPVPVAPTRALGATFVIAVSVIGNQAALVARRVDDPSPARLRRVLSGVWHSIRGSQRGGAALQTGADDVEATVAHSDGLASILCKASMVVQSTIAAARLRESPPDCLIAPAAHHIGVFEVHRAAEAIEAGRAAARAALPGLLTAIEAARNDARRWWNVRAISSDRAAA